MGLTQAQFGLLVHAHANTVWRWEKGDLEPDDWQDDLMDDLADAVRRADAERLDKVAMLVGAGLAGAALGVLLAMVVDKALNDDAE